MFSSNRAFSAATSYLWCEVEIVDDRPIFVPIVRAHFVWNINKPVLIFCYIVRSNTGSKAEGIRTAGKENHFEREA